MDNFKFNIVLSNIFGLLDKANAYINKTEPWALFKNGDIKKLQTIIYNLHEVIKTVSVLLYPFIPETCEKISTIYGYNISSFEMVNEPFKENTKLLKENLILFNKIKK